MATYRVTVEVTAIYSVIIEADSTAEAENDAILKVQALSPEPLDYRTMAEAEILEDEDC